MFAHKLKMILVAGGLVAFAGVAAAGEVTGNNRQWKPWHDAAMCKLRLDKVYQPNSGQPIHVVISNLSNIRLQYKVGITVVKGGRSAAGGEILVDNANPGERSERPSNMAFPGSIDGSVVRLLVTSCSKRS